ncbi:18629_t:CDS:2 [Acaulospora morrowiae]|uniref:Glycerol-3-phosphate dehydrogenase [NAD(+)] n=1 Tax=Acaulospora morrowiae TaxID=94023 RepID=A0A9N9A1M3_9GLOM|nr:18629_t:CDS:2 [Acaulospora morrowiae]
MVKEIEIVSEERVAVIGSGNWGTVVARIVGRNVKRYADFHPEVKMWVFEELIKGRKLTEIINQQHENVKYLPGFKIPENVVAVPDLLDATRDATSLIFVVPHQFLHDICNQLKGRTHPKAKAISLVKGFNTTDSGIQPMSQVIEDILQLPVCTLSGANIANEIAEERFSETTIGYKFREEGELFKKLLETHYFRIGIVNDVVGVELCGALKNVIAVGAGIIDGLKMGDNTKAAIIRIGVLEMKSFIQRFYKGAKDETFFQSCGLADVITSCYGGRNRRIAEAHVVTGKSFEQLEKELLNGQKLQGPLTAKELNRVLSHKGLEDEYKLFTAIYRIVYEGLPPRKIFDQIV